jgi:hypothetical protein
MSKQPRQFCPGLLLQKSLAGVAQSVEQRTRNAKVVGSIPIPGTTHDPVGSFT